VPRLALKGPSAAAVTGTLLGVAGIVAVGLALRLALRGTRTRTKLLALPVVLILLQWIAVPALNTGLATHAPRDDVPSARTLGLAGARDAPSRRRTARGWPAGTCRDRREGPPPPHPEPPCSSSTARTTTAPTRAPTCACSRGAATRCSRSTRRHGESSGRANALGWKGWDDVAGALAFLRRQPEVEPRQIAALGLSMGAEEALRASAGGIALRAIVADGAGASTAGDARLTTGGVLPASVTWTTMRAGELLSGDDEPPPLHERVTNIHVPALLIASNADGELAIDRAYAERIGPHAELWHVADAGHTRALATHPARYELRVTGFLRRALAG
jgi:hypothetical protein